MLGSWLRASRYTSPVGATRGSPVNCCPCWCRRSQPVQSGEALRGTALVLVWPGGLGCVRAGRRRWGHGWVEPPVPRSTGESTVQSTAPGPLRSQAATVPVAGPTGNPPHPTQSSPARTFAAAAGAPAAPSQAISGPAVADCPRRPATDALLLSRQARSGHSGTVAQQLGEALVRLREAPYSRPSFREEPRRDRSHVRPTARRARGSGPRS